MSDYDEKVGGMSFADLIAPFDVDTFHNTVRGRRWLHVPGASEKTSSIFNWDHLNTILNMDVWTAGTVTIMLDGQRAPPMAYCNRTVNRNKLSVMQPDPGKIIDLMRHGASMVLDDIASLVPSVGAVAEILKRTFHAKAAANVYFSQKRHRAFQAHYDRHDVFSLQIHGEKIWRVYRGRADNPIEHDRFLNIPQAEYDGLKGAIDQEVRMAPGDLLYLPRGLCHDALAVSDLSLHLTFSCALPMGLHLIEDMMERLIGESLFRDDLPRIDGRDGEAALAARIDALMTRLVEIYGGENGLKLAGSIIRGFGDDASAEFALPSVRPMASKRSEPTGERVSAFTGHRLGRIGDS